MKITAIRLKNINSIRGEQEINFMEPPLSEAGLFAITGPTGSGKTTLLDVITLALYNRIPRIKERVSKNFIDKTGSILTRNTGEAYAEVSYSCQQGHFTSKWSISTARTGNLRDYEMEISDTKTGKIIESQKNQVPEVNERLIGLNYEQFTRSILLAQGDFAAFLQSKKEDRGKLLEKITGSWIYRQIGKRAFEMNKQLGESLKLLNRQLESTEEKLLSKEAFQELKDELVLISRKWETTNASKMQIQQLLDRKKQWQQLEQRILQSVEEERVLQEDIDAFDQQYLERLSRHQALIPVQTRLHKWNQLQQLFTDTAQQEEPHKNNIHRWKIASQQAKAEIDRLLQTETPTKNLLFALSALEKKVLDIDLRLHEYRQLYRNDLQATEEICGELSWPFDRKDLVQCQKQIRKEIKIIRQQWQSLSKKLPRMVEQDHGQELEDLEKWLGLVNEWAILEARLAPLKKEVLRLKKETKQLKQQDRAITKALQEAENRKRLATLELNNLKNEQKIIDQALQIRRLQQQLKSGEPCPICGATSHPATQHLIEPPTIEPKELETAEQKFQQQLSELATLQAEHRQISSQISTNARLHQEQLHQTEMLCQQIEQLIGGLPEPYRKGPARKQMEVLQDTIKQVRVLNELQIRLEKMQQADAQLIDLIRAQEEGQALKKQRKALFAGIDIRAEVTRLREQWNNAQLQLQNAKTSLKEWAAGYQNLAAELAALEQAIDPALQALGYNDAKSAWSDLLAPEEYDQLHNRRTALRQALQLCRNDRQALLRQQESLGSMDDSISIDRLEHQFRAIEEDLRHLQEERDLLIGQKSSQEQYRKELGNLRKELSSQRKENQKWVLLNKYIGDSEGKKFSTFAQQLTLAQLVQLANERLHTLSQRYQLAIPGAREDDSLVIIDGDLGSMRRSVKTLSGGESFLISLSLALALSDLASRHVEIQSLFIDEGFGSLDADTLDQTLDTLEKLQAESEKTIGVISHVDSLKERIITQIELIPNGQGHSKIRVRQL